MPSIPPRALIAGLGLIGGSLGMALRARGWRVAFFDPNVTLDAARERGAADERVEHLSGADLLVLAAPVDVATSQLQTLDAGASTVVTSVGSVMQPFRTVADERGLLFVSGHPLAGSQQQGLGTARADLFAGRRWFVDAREALVDRMVADTGALLEVVTAAEHDRAVALTSHLPQLLSTALGAWLEEQRSSSPDLLHFGGTGLQTFLRLAGSDASVWAPVIDANRVSIGEHLQQVISIARGLLDGDDAAFADAQKAWKALEEEQAS